MTSSELTPKEISFRERFLKKSRDLKDLDAILDSTSETLQEIRNDTGIIRTGLVSGKIRDENPYKELLNRRYIQGETERMRQIVKGMIPITFGDIFGEQNDLYKRATEGLSPEERGIVLCNFCVELVDTEITDLILLPGWESSEGAKLEHSTVFKKKGTIFYPDNSHDLILPR